LNLNYLASFGKIHCIKSLRIKIIVAKLKILFFIRAKKTTKGTSSKTAAIWGGSNIWKKS